MFNSSDEQNAYIKETYPEVTDSRLDDDHWDLLCDTCRTVRGFQVVERSEGRLVTPYKGYSVDHFAPIAIYFRCPVCKAYKQWIVFKLFDVATNPKTGQAEVETKYFRVASLPGEGSEDISEIPADQVSLRTAYKQAIRAMDANAHIAAAAMFRRALQVITREILGAKPGNLANELREVIGKQVNGVTITNDFAAVGYIVKEAGNQGAHPDQDPDLLDFTAEDARDLQSIFMELVSELFIVPAAKKKAKEEFLNRRKIK